jgi:hypothetical protein
MTNLLRNGTGRGNSTETRTNISNFKAQMRLKTICFNNKTFHNAWHDKSVKTKD